VFGGASGAMAARLGAQHVEAFQCLPKQPLPIQACGLCARRPSGMMPGIVLLGTMGRG
jgi:hypothetical protein